jgi:hypothetical protein
MGATGAGITEEEVDITAEATTAAATTVEAVITGASAVMEAGTTLMG